MVVNYIKKWNRGHLDEIEMILVGGGSVVLVLGGEVNLWGGTHGGPGKVGGQCCGEKDEDEPERAHVLQGNKEN